MPICREQFPQKNDSWERRSHHFITSLVEFEQTESASPLKIGVLESNNGLYKT
jgi:hypothetical protein